MNHPSVFRLSAAAVALGMGVLASPVVVFASPVPAKPNIVFIMADDLGIGDVHCYNPDSKIPTPNMDALAREGARFADAHTSASVCTPSRYSVLTGRYCWRTRLKSQVLWTTFDEPLIEKGRMTVASLAKKHGYATACIGKWHLGMNFYKKNSNEFARGKRHHMSGKGGCRDVDFTRDAAYSPNDVGFDFSFVSGAGHNMEPFCFIKNRRAVPLPTAWREANTPTLPGSSGRESHEGWMAPGWIDEQVDIEFTNQAVKFIERTHKENPGKPFFLYFTPVAPHRPCVPVKKFKGKSGIGLREDFAAQFDWEVGEVMKALERTGLAENTLLIVTSDNGAVQGGKGHHSSGKFRGQKLSLFEGGHRVPFLVRWPGKTPKASVNDTPLCLTGLLATCAEMFGDPLPAGAGEDSTSFLPALLGKENRGKENAVIVHNSYGGRFAIRLGKWKLIPGKNMLFDMENDPYEKKNVFGEHPDVVKRLQAELEKVRRGGGLRVLTYNIHHAAGMDGKVDLERIAKVIRSANPDIVALQEVDKGVPRSGNVDEAAKLAELTGMRVVFSKSISLGGGAYGNALLSRLPVLGHEVVPLPGHEPRSVLVAKLRVDKDDPKSDITFFATHLPLQEANRVKCAEKISAYLKEHKVGAALLAGDLNARPESAPIKVLAKDWTNASAGRELLTMPANKPASQIDYVLFRPADGWKVVETKVLDEKVASDHRPFLVALERLGAAPPKIDE